MDLPFNLIVLKVFHAQKNRIRPLIAEIGLSPGQPKILGFLTVHDNCRQKKLAESCDIDPATISKLLDHMAEKELIIRTGVPGDRRASGIRITPKGRAVHELLAERFEQVNVLSLSGFSEAEKNEFKAYLRRMYRNLTGMPMPD